MSTIVHVGCLRIAIALVIALILFFFIAVPYLLFAEVQVAADANPPTPMDVRDNPHP